MALESWSLGHCGVCPYVLKAWIMSAHMCCWLVHFLRCGRGALTELGLRHEVLHCSYLQTQQEP